MAIEGLRRSGLSTDERSLVALLHQTGENLPSPEHVPAFGACFERYGKADVLLLGEATHGTSEFYRSRAAISRHLIQNHGFNIIAVEADWPDAARIDRYARHRAPQTDEKQAFARFPSWMWRNQEVLEFVHWLRAENEHRPVRDRVEFRGLDIYSLSTSMAAVLAYLDRADPAAASLARQRYGCLTPWQDEPSVYGRHASIGGETCEREVRDQLVDLLKRRLEYAARDGEPFFDAAQNARIVRAAERYYRIMYHGSSEFVESA